MVYLGTDFGGSKICVGVVDGEGRILARSEVPTESAGGVEHVLSQLDRAFREACRAAEVDLAALEGIGVAAPGQVDGATGAIVHAPNLGWRDVPLGALLAARYDGMPIAIENDVNAACLGEAHRGAARGARDVVAIFVGTGIGGGIFANGALVGGAIGAAGEIGHLVYRPEGAPCSCGKLGHFESYAGGGPVERNFRARVARGLATAALARAGGDLERIHLGVIFEAADAGDPACREVVSEMEAALGTLAANLASALNPAVIVVGGGVVRRRRSLVAVCARAVRELATEAAARVCRVVESQLWEDAAVLGSAEAVAGRRRGGP
jgi:glucokinase